MNQEHRVASPFQSFNARSLPASRVAETFIPPPQFDTLIERQHHLLIGPRGSGKTTLLKMLQTTALEAWGHPHAPRFRELIDYTGVFIPTDIAWLSQLNSLTDRGMEPMEAEVLSRSLFTTHAMKSLVTALDNRLHPEESARIAFRRLVADENVEGNLVTELAAAWGLHVRVPSLSGLALALSTRLMQISAFAKRELGLSSEGRRERIASSESLHIDFITAATIFVETVELFFPATRNERWALLFDELELAPPSIRDDLIAAIRSVDSRFLFKLSLSPYTSQVTNQGEVTSPMAGHDHLELNLTYANSTDAYGFCRELFMRIVADFGIDIKSPADLLGGSIFGIDESFVGHSISEAESEYRPGGRLGKRFISLAKADETFRHYLDEHKIDVQNLDKLPQNLRDRYVRKVRSIVAVRSEYRSADDLYASTRRRTRGRKNPVLYSGERSTFAMAEGNPRWLIGLTTRLLRDDRSKSRVIPPNVQARETALLANRFRALLKTIPTIAPSGYPRGLLSILDPIGEYFHDQVVRRAFNADPVGSFVVDADSPAWLIDSLGKALNTGAIIYVPDPDASSIVSSIKGKRFRLSYALAPHYGLPLLLLREISLKTILTRQSDQDTLEFEELGGRE